LIDCFHRPLGATDVLRLLQHTGGTASGGRGAPDRAGGDRLAAEEGAQDAGAPRERGLNALLGGLLALAGDRLLGATTSLLQGGLLRRIFLAKHLGGLVP